MMLAIPHSSAAITIGSLHCSGPDGVSKMKGQAVTVTGVVVGQFSTARNAKLYVQDETGAVCVFGSSKDCAAVGDSLRVDGVVGGYNGLTEITGAADQAVVIANLGHATRIPAPQLLTLAQVNATEGADGCEPNESRLIQLSNVRILSAAGDSLAVGSKFADNTNYRLVPAGADTVYVTLRVSDPEGCDLSKSLEGQPIPLGRITIVAILSQYTGRGQSHGGYQVLPRGRDDIRAAASAKPAKTTQH
jgi:predicted extracellular nuclease